MRIFYLSILCLWVSIKCQAQHVDTVQLSYAHYIDTINDVQYYVSVRDTSLNTSDTNWTAMPMTVQCRHDKFIHLYGNGYSRWYLFLRRTDAGENPNAYYMIPTFLICYKQYGKPYVVVKIY